MQDKSIALVTWANQGIGLQIAKELAAHGFTVLVGSRNFDRGKARKAPVVTVRPGSACEVRTIWMNSHSIDR